MCVCVCVCVCVCQFCDYNNYHQNTFSFGFGSSSQRIWLDNVICTSSESRIVDCSHNTIGNNNCNHFQAVMISCIGKDKYVTQSLEMSRLIRSPTRPLLLILTQAMVIFVWLKAADLSVHSQQGDWRSTLMESGGPSATTASSLRRLMLPVDNWGTQKHFSMGTTLGMYKMITQ